MNDPAETPSSRKRNLEPWVARSQTLLSVVIIFGVCAAWMTDHLQLSQTIERNTKIHEQERSGVNDRATEMALKLDRIYRLIERDPLRIDPYVERSGKPRIRASGRSLFLYLPTEYPTPFRAPLRTMREESFQELAMVPSIEGLWIDNIEEDSVSETCLLPLKKLEKLKEIQVNGPWITDQVLRQIGELHQLRELSIQNAKISKTGLASIRHLTSLRRLTILRSKISDEGVAELSGLENLSFLWVSYNNLTDGCIPHLVKLQNLQELFVKNMGLSTEGVAEFRRLRPDCKVMVTNRHGQIVSIDQLDPTETADQVGNQ